MKPINWILITCAIAIGVARGSRLFHSSHPNPDAGMAIPDAGTPAPKRRRQPSYKDAYGPRAVADRLYFDDLIPREPSVGPGDLCGVIFPVPPGTYGIIFWPLLDSGYEDGGIFLPNASRCAPADGGYLCRRPIP